MSYVDDHLMPGERVVYRGRQHWALFGWPIVLALLALAGLLAAGQIPALEPYWPVALVPAAVALVLLPAPLLRYLTSEYAVTDRRVLIKVGLFQRRSLETLLPKIEAIGVEQGLLDRVLDRGTITITGTGGTREAFPDVAEPLEFRRHVQAQIVALEEQRRVAVGAGDPWGGVRVGAREERECPWCAELILVRARVCKHCGRSVEM